MRKTTASSAAKRQYYRGGQAYQKLGIRKLRSEFQHHGYELVNAKQHFRHAYGQVRDGTGVYFFKVSSSPGASKLLSTEMEFLDAFKRHLRRRKSCFQVPDLLQSGRMFGCKFYVSSFCPGVPLALPRVDGTRGLGTFLSDLTEMSLYILTVRRVQFCGDRAWLKLRQPEKKYLRIVRQWAQIASNQSVRETADLWQVAQSLGSLYRPRLAHGDFAPWHVLRDGSQLTLIDSELASNFHPKYYDIAHCYHRLCTATGQIDLAKEYALSVRGRLPLRARQRFDLTMRAIVAARTIGGFCELAVKPQSSKLNRFHVRLARSVVKDELY